MPVIENFQAFMASGGLVCPTDKQKIEYAVADEPGLFVECRASIKSQPTWYLRQKNEKGTNTYHRLGIVKDLSLSQACKLARQHKTEHRVNLKAAVTADLVKPEMTLDRFFHDVYLPQAKIHKRSWVKDESLYRMRIGPKFGHIALSGLNRLDVQAFHQGLLAEGLAAATCNHHVVLMRRFLSVAVSLDLIQKNVLKGIPLMPLANFSDVYLSKDETARLVEVLTTDANKPVCAALLFILNTAARKMEALKAKWSDIDMVNRVWHIPTENNKSKRPKTLPLNDGAMQVLSQLESNGKCEYVFPNPETGLPYTSIARVFWRLRKKADLPKNFRVHDFRGSFSERYLGANGSIFTLQKLLGHQDVRTTATRYARLSARSLLDGASLASVPMPQMQPRTT
jgi:integrase